MQVLLQIVLNNLNEFNIMLFLLKWLQKDHPSKDQQIHYQCNRNISPVDLLILKYIRRVRS